MADLSTAQPINDRWELVEPIGTGAMGEVWRGRHRVLGHDVAVKLMKAAASRDSSLVARFVREARIAAQLRHRHVARVEDFGTTEEGRPFLVMELLQGESLEDRLQREGRFDPYLVVTVARHVGAACDAAHAAGVVHRDLKPSNCFLVREDGAPVVKVIDFGVARWADGMKLTRHDGDNGPMLLGTPSYMAPEQIDGGEGIDGRADLWSIAVMLYELLTGRLPFEASTLPALFYAVTMTTPAPPSRYAPALGAEVDAWAVRALARDRDARFPTGHALAEALAAALAGVALGRSSLPATRETPVVMAPTERAFPAMTAAGMGRPSLPDPQGRSTFDAVSLPGPTNGRESAMSIVPPNRRVALVASIAVGLLVGIGVATWLARGRTREATETRREPPVVTVVPPTPAPVVAARPAAPAPAPAPVLAPAPVVRPAAVAVRPLPVARPVPFAAPSHAPSTLVFPPTVAAPTPRPPPQNYNPEEP